MLIKMKTDSSKVTTKIWKINVFNTRAHIFANISSQQINFKVPATGCIPICTTINACNCVRKKKKCKFLHKLPHRKWALIYYARSRSRSAHHESQTKARTSSFKIPHLGWIFLLLGCLSVCLGSHVTFRAGLLCQRITSSFSGSDVRVNHPRTLLLNYLSVTHNFVAVSKKQIVCLFLGAKFDRQHLTVPLNGPRSRRFRCELYWVALFRLVYLNFSGP